MAHFHMLQNKIIYLVFDLEHGGEECGVLQLSGELVRLDLVGTNPRADKAENISRCATTFNKYVRCVV